MINLFRIVAIAFPLGFFLLLLPASADHTPLDAAAGRLLVASEAMNDSRFAGSVILLLQHNLAGSIGLIMNSRSELLPGELPQEIAPGLKNIYFGGPVDPLAVSILVFGEDPPEQAKKILKDVHLAGLGDLGELLKQRENSGFRVFLGYSGWAPGQLDMELAHGAWQVYPANERLLSHEEDIDQLWKQLIETGPVISL